MSWDNKAMETNNLKLTENMSRKRHLQEGRLGGTFPPDSSTRSTGGSSNYYYDYFARQPQRANMAQSASGAYSDNNNCTFYQKGFLGSTANPSASGFTPTLAASSGSPTTVNTFNCTTGTGYDAGRMPYQSPARVSSYPNPFQPQQSGTYYQPVQSRLQQQYSSGRTHPQQSSFHPHSQGQPYENPFGYPLKNDVPLTNFSFRDPPPTAQVPQNSTQYSSLFHQSQGQSSASANQPTYSYQQLAGPGLNRVEYSYTTRVDEMASPSTNVGGPPATGPSTNYYNWNEGVSKSWPIQDASSHAFQRSNDSATMEMQKPDGGKEDDLGGASVEKGKPPSTPSSSNVDEKKSTRVVIGKRRGGRMLPTGVIKRTKESGVNAASNNTDNKATSWSRYMEEVQQYRNQTCSDDGQHHPLVK